MTSVREQLVQSLDDREFRDLFVDEQIGQLVALQIRAMRKARGWTQARLAAEIGTVQEVISKLEDPDYGKPTLTTLKRLRAAFDVGLIVRFAPYSALVDWAVGQTYSDINLPDYDHDVALAPRREVSETMFSVLNISRSRPEVLAPPDSGSTGGNVIQFQERTAHGEIIVAARR